MSLPGQVEGLFRRFRGSIRIQLYLSRWRSSVFFGVQILREVFVPGAGVFRGSECARSSGYSEFGIGIDAGAASIEGHNKALA
jgi:hypothetical protein